MNLCCISSTRSGLGKPQIYISQPKQSSKSGSAIPKEPSKSENHATPRERSSKDNGAKIGYKLFTIYYKLQPLQRRIIITDIAHNLFTTTHTKYCLKLKTTPSCKQIRIPAFWAHLQLEAAKAHYMSMKSETTVTPRHRRPGKERRWRLLHLRRSLG